MIASDLDIWEWTDNAADPCPLCVQWHEGDEPEDARPYWPNGSTPPRVYRFTHRRCQRAAMRYTEGAGE